MKYAFILTWQVAFPVTLMCRVLGVSTSAFYDWKSEPMTKREQRDAILRSRLRIVFNASRQTYGSPRVHVELRSGGTTVSRWKGG